MDTKLFSLSFKIAEIKQKEQHSGVPWRKTLNVIGGCYFLRRYSLITATIPAVRPMAIAAMPPSISGTGGVVAWAVLDNRVRNPMNGVTEIIFFIVTSSSKLNCDRPSPRLAVKGLVSIISCGGAP